MDTQEIINSDLTINEKIGKILKLIEDLSNDVECLHAELSKVEEEIIEIKTRIG